VLALCDDISCFHLCGSAAFSAWLFYSVDMLVRFSFLNESEKKAYFPVVYELIALGSPFQVPYFFLLFFFFFFFFNASRV
jgi:hypothetical protein